MCNALQTAEQDAQAHHVQVGTQRIHDSYQVLCVEAVLQSVIVSSLGQRVVQNLIEATAYQLFTDQVLQKMLLILITLVHKR